MSLYVGIGALSILLLLLTVSGIDSGNQTMMKVGFGMQVALLVLVVVWTLIEVTTA